MANDDLDNDEQSDDPGRLRKMYEEEAKARADAQSELAALKTREVFRDAGLDPSNKLHAVAIKGYDGALDPDAVKTYVTELGLNQAPAPPEVQNPASAEEQAANERIAQAGAGDGTPPPEPDKAEAIRKQIAERAMHGASIAELDRLSEDFARARGTLVKSDVHSQS